MWIAGFGSSFTSDVANVLGKITRVIAVTMVLETVLRIRRNMIIASGDISVCTTFIYKSAKAASSAVMQLAMIVNCFCLKCEW